MASVRDVPAMQQEFAATRDILKEKGDENPADSVPAKSIDQSDLLDLPFLFHLSRLCREKGRGSVRIRREYTLKRTM